MSLTGFLDFSAGRRRGSPVSLYREGLVGFDDFDVGEIGLEGGEVGVALVGVVDVTDEPFIDAVGEGAVNFRSTDDKDFFICDRNLGRAVDDINASVVPIAISGEDDVPAFWQGATNRLKRFSTHQHRMAEGGFFEEREVFRQMPRQSAASSDQAVRIHGDDGG